MTSIKTFVSYSWTTPEHADWVRELAESLRADGFETILDQWHLREGQDRFAFMEQMVTDPDVKKVLLICDKRYSERANRREGGVGAESTIISSEVYGKADQKKFIPIIREKDEEGRPYLPVFLNSRIFIDLSDDTRYGENYEALLRALADKPARVPPPVGKRPSFLSDDGAPTYATTYKKRSALSAVVSGKATAQGFAADYLDAVQEELQKVTVSVAQRRQAGAGDRDALGKALLEPLEAWSPLRDEFMDFVSNVLRYGGGRQLAELLPKFFERCVPTATAEEVETEPARFALYEMFLLSAALLFSAEEFETLDALLSRKYRDERPYSRLTMRSFNVFDASLQNLENAFSNASGNRWNSAAGTLLKQRLEPSAVSFDLVVETDILLYLRTRLQNTEDFLDLSRWWPNTFPYLERPLMGYGLENGAIRFFVSARSRKYFTRFKTVLGVESREDLLARWDALQSKDVLGQMVPPAKLREALARFATEP